MLALAWLGGLLRRRTAQLAASAVAVALAVALVASIATFLSGALKTMTVAATAQVAVDWQVQAGPNADPTAVLTQVRADTHVRAALPVEFAVTSGLQATSAGSVQTTGPGVVVGLPDGYAATFPGELRLLSGDARGVLLSQQTAANLHARPGDTVMVALIGQAAAALRIDGVVDLPLADSLFQTVGAPAGSQPSAPPDNVVVLPANRWHALFDSLGATRPDVVHFQVHARLDHHLARDPAAAFNQVAGAARHFEAAVAGGSAVGDNLGAALDAARKDAVYAQILFVLLGLPGVVLAGLLTATVAGAGADRRRRDLALLRVRGATAATMLGTAVAEAAAIAIGGSALGLATATAVGRAEFGSATFGASSTAALAWGVASLLAGVVIAGAALVVPAWRDARRLTVVSARHVVGRPPRPLWLRGGLDVLLLAAAALVFWLTSRAGYQIVLVPEGLPTLSVNYWSLSGPLLFWAGSGLLAFRAADELFGRGRRLVKAVARPVAGGLAGTIAASLSRHRRRLARPVALVVLTVAFAVSTAVFNSTFHQQVGVDALLSNGADVTVAYPPASPASTGQVAAIAAVRGVHHVEPVLHRFAYVGADLQDLFGVHPTTVVGAAKLQNAYFRGGTASALIGRLARQPDGLLVSAETVKDFQLIPGDQMRLRVRDARSGRLIQVTFHYIGIAKEFPTAPRDSFLIANADYVAAQSGNAGTETLLVSTSSPPAVVAQRVRDRVGTAATVSDLVTSRHQVGSTLTAVDLSGLTRVELGFALVLAAAATGLVLALGLAQRRRSFAIIRALGADHQQVAAFVRVEAGVVTITGLVLGAATGWGLSVVLVKILTGVFDPPPAALSVPWGYLGVVAVLAAAAAAAAGELTVRAARRPVVETIRDL
ncbi:MAG: ABC transporter permease [Acidimicrobiales bacterium]